MRDLLKMWFVVLVVQVAEVLLLPREWKWRLPRLVGLLQFYPYLFFAILTVLRVRFVIRSEKKNYPYKRKFTKKQFWLAELVFMVLLPALIVWGLNAYYNYNLMPISWLWVVQIIVYVLLFHIIIFMFEIPTMYTYHLPGFVFSFMFILLGNIYFSHVLTFLVARSVMLAFMILGILIVGCFAFPLLMSASPYWIIIKKKKK